MYNLFLDDFRHPYDAFLRTQHISYSREKWVIVRNYKQFVKCIKRNGLPKIVSFDHDLADNDCEDWKDIVGYEGIYQVSSLGRVVRIKRCKGASGYNILKPSKNESGLYVTLRNNGNDCRRKIHRLVMESFYGINPKKPQVNHKDGNRWNNHIDNLEWCTNTENLIHSHRELTREFTSYGESHKNSLRVSQYDKKGSFINTYGSIHEAGRQLNIQFTNIAKCGRGERKTAGGFVWKYEDNEVTVNSKIAHIDKKEKDYSKNFFIPELEEMTGYDCAKWLIDYCIVNNQNLPETILIHSANSVGRENIKSLFETYKKEGA